MDLYLVFRFPMKQIFTFFFLKKWKEIPQLTTRIKKYCFNDQVDYIEMKKTIVKILNY